LGLYYRLPNHYSYSGKPPKTTITTGPTHIQVTRRTHSTYPAQRRTYRDFQASRLHYRLLNPYNHSEGTPKTLIRPPPLTFHLPCSHPTYPAHTNHLPCTAPHTHSTYPAHRLGENPFISTHKALTRTKRREEERRKEEREIQTHKGTLTFHLPGADPPPSEPAWPT
jgi:hypothetical protein